MKEFLLKTPDLGDTDKIELIQWNYKPGDKINQGDEIIELVTDKAAFPVESPFSGTLKSILLPAGSIVKKGEILGILEILE